VVTQAGVAAPLIIGHIETKDVGTDLLAIHRDSERANPRTQDGAQLRRYRNALDNLVLSNYLDFRWYHGGEIRLTASLGELKQRATISWAHEAPALDLLADFLTLGPRPIANAQELAKRLARLTHLLRDVILTATEHEASPLFDDLYKAFGDVLIADLQKPVFADIYAQTLSYGLFAARLQHDPSSGLFRRSDAGREIPRANPFLRRLFNAISGPELDDEPYSGIVDAVAQVLGHADLDAILRGFGAKTHTEDPLVHFYETFLAEYDPQLREKRGVYYTPDPVVSYIVRSVDCLLREVFAMPDGLATTTPGSQSTTPSVLVLDPACGTGTFLYHCLALVRERFKAASNAGQWESFVHDHLVPRLFGFELLLAPYAIAHIKLGLALAGADLPLVERPASSYSLKDDERLQVYLTNSLEQATKRSHILFGGYIADEANSAAQVKQDLPIMIVVGNPPYSSSIFGGEWIMELLNDYKSGLRETKSDLNREEWKFLRFAQWRIDQTGRGVVGLVINNSFLDGVTFRVMRKSLLTSFDYVWVLDLNGSIKSSRARPPGLADENVFEIQQGVTIVLLVKTAAQGNSQVHHHEVWGPRSHKYDWLSSNDSATTEWRTFQPSPPYYRFVPEDEAVAAEYESARQITHLFGIYSSGIQTKRDKLAVQSSPQSVYATVRRFISDEPEKVRAEFGLGEDGDGWSVERAQKDVRASGPTEANVIPILYRPFDARWTYFTGKSGGFLGRPRAKVMRHMIAGPNLGLLMMRQTVGGYYSYACVTRLPTCHGTFYLGNKGQDYLAPLYLYPDAAGPQKAAAELESWSRDSLWSCPKYAARSHRGDRAADRFEIHRHRGVGC
jgi:hypothetical protein